MESGVPGVIELSRTRNLRNTCIIRGDRGEIEIGVGPNGPVTLRANGVELGGAPRLPDRPDASPIDLMRIQVEEFADALRSGRDCHLFAEHTLDTIRLFDACKTRPSRSLELPWEQFAGASSLPDLTGRTVLVLGGTGFIGGRLVEALVRHTGARVRVLARNLARLANVSRFSIDVVRGDITDVQALARALEGCDLVFNCTFGRNETATLINVDAVRTLVEQAAAAGVPRVIHVSTVSAYGTPPDGDLSESDPHHAEKSFVYGYTKWQGEQAALDAARRLRVDVRILQPTVVYGPGAPSWTINPLRMLKSGRVVLVNGGTGLCNPVYVDDVVQAMLRAGVAKEGSGERFLVSGRQTVTWREFYERYERMLGQSSTIDLSLDEVNTRRRDMERRYTNRAQLAALLRHPVLVKQLAALPVSQRLKSMLSRSAINAIKKTALRSPTAAPGSGTSTASRPKPVHVLSELDAAFQAAKVRVSIAKAERLLGYVPTYSFEQGMECTQTWAAWANLL
jgi:nucleoside-diphosphate-sugar epimerase